MRDNRTMFPYVCQQCAGTFLRRHYPPGSHKTKYCSRACYYEAKRQSIPSIAERFWSKVDKSGECWLWTGARRGAGYGAFGVHHGTVVDAHRFAYELVHGPILDGFHVLHHCDNPPCVRPSHLFRGTAKDNAADMIAKGRNPRGETHHIHLHPECVRRGETSGTAKLTEVSVRAIRQRYAAGNLTQAALSREFGVSRRTIGMIVTYQIWKHLD